MDVTLTPFDEVVVTGVPYEGLEHPRVLIDFPALVAGVYEDGYIKVWPLDAEDDQLTPRERRHGQLWFHRDESAWLVQSDEPPQSRRRRRTHRAAHECG